MLPRSSWCKWSCKGWIRQRSKAFVQAFEVPPKWGFISSSNTDHTSYKKGDGHRLKRRWEQGDSRSYPSGIKSRILKTFDGLRVLCLHNDPSSCSGVSRWHATVLIPPDEHLQLQCSSAIISVLDKTAWSTLVTLEIRIREISWQAIWEPSNQVSKNSVGRLKGEGDHAVSSAVLLSTRRMANCHSRCAQNVSELQAEWHPKNKKPLWLRGVRCTLMQRVRG